MLLVFVNELSQKCLQRLVLALLPAVRYHELFEVSFSLELVVLDYTFDRVLPPHLGESVSSCYLMDNCPITFNHFDFVLDHIFPVDGFSWWLVVVLQACVYLIQSILELVVLFGPNPLGQALETYVLDRYSHRFHIDITPVLDPEAFSLADWRTLVVLEIHHVIFLRFLFDLLFVFDAMDSRGIVQYGVNRLECLVLLMAIEALVLFLISS